MKKLYLLSLLFSLSVSLWGQQEEQYTQFMFYKLGLNPGYAGSHEGATVSALVRNQWIGLEGAPQTQLVSFELPLLNQRVGVGGSILRQTIGVTEAYTAEGVYAYRVRLGRGMLGMGLQASVRLWRANFSQLEGTQPVDQDEAVPAGQQSKYLPNFGAGLYYSNENFYFGIAAPRLLQNNIDFAESGDIISREVQHFNLMGGIIFTLSEKVKMQPQVLLKYVRGAPFDGDLNLNFIFMDRLTTGLSYRLGGSQTGDPGEAISLLLGLQITDNILFGVAYDATLSELKNYNSGTIEGALRYFFSGRSRDVNYANPRFF